MTPIPTPTDHSRTRTRSGTLLLLTGGLLTLTACASQPAAGPAQFTNPPGLQVDPPSPDPRVGLAPGMFDAGEAAWNLRMLSTTPPPEEFVGTSNSDLAFTGTYAIQGNYSGVQVWDISDPANPLSVVTYVCPASQSDVSVYENLLFVSGEDFSARLDCGDEGVEEQVSHERLRGIRIFDISDIANPQYIGNVQTCRGSHTHTVLEHPGDEENVYVYVSGAAPVRPTEELAGCSSLSPAEDPNSALFRIEVIRVPLADPAAAAIVSSPRIFEDLVAPPRHGPAPADLVAAEEARAQAEEAWEAGGFVVEIQGQTVVLPDEAVGMMLGQLIAERGGDGPPTAADSAALREQLDSIVAAEMAAMGMGGAPGDGPAPGPSQCHDITVYPAIGLAGGACRGYGMLLDISDPANPRRIAEVADSNFSYWHSATFNNDGTAIMFTDEWGGGGGPKCRADDPMEWGANAIFTVEIGYHDRGPFNADRMQMAGSWSVYWYNGVIVNSEIARGMDIFELTPNETLTQNEIDAANSVHLTHLNSQGQPVYEWPATFALARAYLDQLERWHGMSAPRVAAARSALDSAESGSGTARRDRLHALANALGAHAAEAADSDKVAKLAEAIRRLADAD